MYQYTFGDTTTEIANTPLSFNSTKYPGVCKPMDFRTLAVFQGLQSQLNRLAQVKGLAKVAVDGDIGPGVISLAGKAGIAPVGSACSVIAANAIVYEAQSRLLADTLKAPAMVSGPAPLKAPSIIDPKTMLDVPAPRASAGLLDGFNNLSTPLKLAAVGVLGGIAYYIHKGSKKKGRR